MATTPVYESTQVCTHCHTQKSLNDFYRAANKRNGRSSWCKECSNGRFRGQPSNWSQNNRDKINANWRRSWNKTQGFLKFVRANGSCAICGEDHPACLDFHHLDPAEKEHRMAECRSIQAAIQEAAKCVLLCRNCHAKGHAGFVDFSDLESMTPAYIDELATQYAKAWLLKEAA